MVTDYEVLTRQDCHPTYRPKINRKWCVGQHIRQSIWVTSPHLSCWAMFKRCLHRGKFVKICVYCNQIMTQLLYYPLVPVNLTQIVMLRLYLPTVHVRSKTGRRLDGQWNFAYCCYYSRFRFPLFSLFSMPDLWVKLY